MIKKIVKQLCPPVFFGVLNRLKKLKPALKATNSSNQHLDMYWSDEFAKVLDTWGEGNVWTEIQYFLFDRKGKVLDIACGTGKTMQILAKFPMLELHGCDISDLLIKKAVERGISKNNLLVCDATQLPYKDNEFSYAYSIGSLEHFTEEGILKFLKECHRTVSDVSFHQHPVSRSGKNEGWITSTQSYHNNSIDWWMQFYNKAYESVYVLDSRWEDEISLGKWFVCTKKK